VASYNILRQFKEFDESQTQVVGSNNNVEKIMGAASKTFIIDCPWCKAKVAAAESGRAESGGFDDDAGEPHGTRVLVGICPSCKSILAGESDQIDFEGFDADADRWSDVVRIYPKPPKVFASYRIPKVVKDSLNEADRSLQAGANIAACVMLGRALEALCRDILDAEVKPISESSSDTLDSSAKPKKKIMLGEGIKRLRDKKVIDDRLFDWSQQLQAFRNLAAHPEDISISRHDAEDLQTFVNAIVEYVYDLADRYSEFKGRVDARARRRKTYFSVAIFTPLLWACYGL
jgi:Domain of unknown function (DUF4145)